MAEFEFLRPYWLPGVIVAIAIGWRLWTRLGSGDQWLAACDERLLPHLLSERPGARSRAPALLVGLGLAIASLALAGPSWRSVNQPVQRTQNARVIILDLSRSMDSADLQPSRLTRARFKAADLLERTREGQVGLVVYAGDAFIVSPLTDDANTLLAMLPALSTSVVPTQGSRADRALTLASELLVGGDARSGEVILISDGVNDYGAVRMAANLAGRGYRVSTLAVGTTEGAPIPMPGGGFLRDDAGRIVITRLSTRGLRDVARAGNGRFSLIAPDDRDVEHLLGALPSGPWQGPTEEAGREAAIRVDDGVWLLPVLLPIAALAFRPGWLLVGAVVFLVPIGPAHAVTWSDLWARPDQQAARALTLGRPGTADRADAGASWRGAARYRQQDYEGAAHAYATLDDAVSNYNRGNALARSGRLKDALSAYDTSLAQDPELEDAKFNRELVAELLRQRRAQSGAGDGESGGRGGQQSRADSRSGPEHTVGGQSAQASERGRGDESIGGTSGPGGKDDGSSTPEGRPEESHADGESRDRESRAGQGKMRTDAASATRGVGSSPTISSPDRSRNAEERQAMEQWLRRIPDDPGGLLRRKFAIELQRRGVSATNERKW